MTVLGGWRTRLIALLGVGTFLAAAIAPVAGATLAPGAAVAPSGAEALRGALAGGVRPMTVSAPWRPPAASPARDAPAQSESQGRVLGGTIVSPRVPPRPVLAAGDFLDVSTATTYTVDPVARAVRVAVDLTAVNRLPVSPGARDYYPAVGLSVQREARQFTAEEGGARDAVTSQARAQDRLLTIQLAARLYVGQTAHVHLTYLLPAGAPRSPSPVRVGAAYSSFVAWALGDRGTVDVVVPPQYTVAVSGGAMDEHTDGRGQSVLSAAVADPSSWYAWVDARNDRALTSRTLNLAGGEQVVVHAWPEDPTWEKSVSKALSTAIPALEKRIGLRWPVSGELSVLEVSSTLLEGYAGFYSAGSQQITISEALDPLTVVHEVSHTWFNASLFADRWITEGLANEYAARTLAGLGVTAGGPGKVRANAPTAFALDTWGAPAPIKTTAQDAREQWAYDASWTVIRQVIAKLGEAKMAGVLAAANAGTSAYSVAGAPEKSGRRADWRRFVDLAEEVGGGRAIAELISPWVLTPAERALLAPRAAARSAYHDLLAKGGDWSPPVVVRSDLDAWDFAGASGAIADAAALLAVRDGLRAAASAERLTLPASLEGAYERAATDDALARATDDEQALRRSLDAVAAADDAVAAPRDWLVGLGLVGQDPSAALAAARAAWSSGDATAAAEQAASAHRALDVAADAGRVRIVAIGAGSLALVLLVILALTVARRRSSRRRQPAGAAAAASGGDAGAALAWSAGPPDPGSASVAPSAEPADARTAIDGDWIDPRLAPPAPPPWWRPAVPPPDPVAPEPYPILPASAPVGPTPQSLADRKDEGAQ